MKENEMGRPLVPSGEPGWIADTRQQEMRELIAAQAAAAGVTYAPRAPRWGAPELEHLNGVPWYDAEPPKRFHRCKAQTRGWMGFDYIERCACGAVGPAPWVRRNETRKSRAR